MNNLLLKKIFDAIKVRWFAFKISFSPKIGLNVKSQIHSLDSPLIISLTSYPKRFDNLHLTLLSLLNQTIKPDEIVLWIAREDINKLPSKVKCLEKKGVSIVETENVLSYKKIIPALKNYPNHFIITVDDDLYYPPTLIEELMNTSKQYPNNVIASRVHLMKFDSDGQILPYNKWAWLEYDNASKNHNFFTSGAGTLFPPNTFYKDISNKKLFMTLAPHADDVWLNWMVRMNEKQVYCVSHIKPITTWPGSQDEALWQTNLSDDYSGNDKQINNLIKKYGLPNILEVE